MLFLGWWCLAAWTAVSAQSSGTSNTYLHYGASASNATINIATSLSLTGVYNDRGVPFQQSLVLWTTRANAQGGLILSDGTRRLVSVTAIDDGSSPGYIQLLYGQYASSINPYYHVLLAAPYTQEVTPILQALAGLGVNRTLFYIGAGSMATFAPDPYPYGYGVVGLSDSSLQNIFDQLFAGMPQLSTVALFSRPDAYTSPIMTEAVALTAQHGMTIVSNTNFSSVLPATVNTNGPAIAPLLQQALMAANPTDGYVDLLIVGATNNADWESVIDALSITGLAPGLALYPEPFVETSASFMAAAQGWLSCFQFCAACDAPATLNHTVYRYPHEFYADYNDTYLSIAGPASTVNFQVIGSLDAIAAALSVAAPTLLPHDIHTAMLSLSGTTIYNNFQVEPRYGYNAGIQRYTYQVRDGQNVRLAVGEAVPFPTSWPWLYVLDGQDIAADGAVSQSAPFLTLSVVIGIFGFWVAFIMIEQMKHVEMHGTSRADRYRWTHIWSVLSLIALVTVTWTTAIMNVASLQLSCSLCSVADVSTIRYDVRRLLLALLPMAAFYALGVWSVTRHVSHRRSSASGDKRQATTSGTKPTSSHSASGSASASTPSASASRSGLAGLWQLAFTRDLGRSHAWIGRAWSLLGGLAFMLAIVVGRYVVQTSLRGLFEWTTAAYWNVLSGLVAWGFAQLAFYLFVHHQQRGQALGVFVLCASVVVDFEGVVVGAASVLYRPHSGEGITDEWFAVGTSTIVILASVLSGVIGISIIGLQFNNMRLSHAALNRALQEKNGKLAKSQQGEERAWGQAQWLYRLAAMQLMESRVGPLVRSQMDAQGELVWSDMAARVLAFWRITSMGAVRSGFKLFDAKNPVYQAVLRQQLPPQRRDSAVGADIAVARDESRFRLSPLRAPLTST